MTPQFPGAEGSEEWTYSWVHTFSWKTPNGVQGVRTVPSPSPSHLPPGTKWSMGRGRICFSVWKPPCLRFLNLLNGSLSCQAWLHCQPNLGAADNESILWISPWKQESNRDESSTGPSQRASSLSSCISHLYLSGKHPTENPTLKMKNFSPTIQND